MESRQKSHQQSVSAAVALNLTNNTVIGGCNGSLTGASSGGSAAASPPGLNSLTSAGMGMDFFSSSGFQTNSNSVSQQQLHFPLQQTSGQQDDRRKTNLIINYLPQTFDSDQLRELFEQLGPVRTHKVIRDKQTSASLCYGFVDFMFSEHADRAIREFHGMRIGNKKLRVAYASAASGSVGPLATSASNNMGLSFGSGGLSALGLNNSTGVSSNSSLTGSSSYGGTSSQSVVGNNGMFNAVSTCSNSNSGNLYIAGIPKSWSDGDLGLWFSNFGKIGQVKLLTEPLSGESKGVGFVVFEEREAAERAIAGMNGVQRPDWPAPLLVKFAEDGQPRRLRQLVSGNVSATSMSQLQQQMTATSGSSVPSDQNLTVAAAMRSLNAIHSTNGANLGSTITDRNGRPIVMEDRTSVASSNSNSVNAASLLQNNGLLTGSSGSNNNFDNQLLEQLMLLNMLSQPSQQNGGGGGCVDSIQPRPIVKNKSTSGFATDLGVVAGQQQQHVKESDLCNLLVASATGNNSSVGSRQMPQLHVHTPLIESAYLSALVQTPDTASGTASVWLKLDNCQPTGSFKLRGVGELCRRAIAASSSHYRQLQIVSSSGGNAGLAAAFSAREFGIPCHVVVPDTTSQAVRRRLRQYGAQVEVYGRVWAEAHQRAQELCVTPGTVLVPPFDHPDLWAGHATLVEEIAESWPAQQPPPDALVLSCGGGGLLAGCIEGLWRVGWIGTAVVVLETRGADCLNRAVQQGRPVLTQVTSVAKSLGASQVSAGALDLFRKHPCALSALVTDKQAVDACLRFLDDHQFLVEPACGAALAAVYSGVLERLRREERLSVLRNAVVVVCGGCATDLATLQRLQRELVDEHSGINCIEGAATAAVGRQSSLVSMQPLVLQEDDEDDLLLLPQLNAPSCLESSSDEEDAIDVCS